MINGFQRMLYNLGTISPYTFIASICLSIRILYSEYLNCFSEQTKIGLYTVITFEDIINFVFSYIPFYIWIIIVLSISVLIYHILFLKISLHNLAKMDFNAISTPKENDKLAQGLGATYLIPVLDWIITENIFDYSERIRAWFLFGISILAFLICSFANRSYVSPVYWIMGYHFHTIQTEGSKSYILMSKTKYFRNKNQVKKVIRLFEDLLIDVSQENI